jgi:hypothetical protein
MPKDRRTYAGSLTPKLPVDIRDGDDNSTWQDLWEFLEER